jgi:DNA-binding MarR family transcriptional regulator
MVTVDNELPSELYLNFQKILRCLNFGRGLNKAPSITGTQMRILSLFNENDIVHISEISRVLGMSIQSANNIIRRLKSIGYVEISKNEKDKRISDIKLTPYGMERFDAFRDNQMKMLNNIINLIDPSERELLSAAVHNVALILAKGSEKAVKKEKNPESELSDEYLL